MFKNKAIKFKVFSSELLHISVENTTFAPLSKQGYTGLVAQLVRATDS